MQIQHLNAGLNPRFKCAVPHLTRGFNPRFWKAGLEGLGVGPTRSAAGFGASPPRTTRSLVQSYGSCVVGCVTSYTSLVLRSSHKALSGHNKCSRGLGRCLATTRPSRLRTASRDGPTSLDVAARVAAANGSRVPAREDSMALGETIASESKSSTTSPRARRCA